MSSPKASRRDFLRLTSAGIASTALGVTSSSYARITGANDRVRVAICGVRGRGNDHIHGFSRVPGTEIAALCDVDENVSNHRLADIEKLGLPKPKSYVDVRKLLEDKDIDAISIAAPNHWHALMAIWACQAGKDVYVEKPCSHNWFEGRQLVRAVKKYNRICQHGSQSRSNPGMLEAIQQLRDGTIGGAALDVWWQYPTPAEPERRPSRRPFHELPNVLITPHSSSSTEATADRRWSVVAANLDRFARGEPLENIVLQT